LMLGAAAFVAGLGACFILLGAFLTGSTSPMMQDPRDRSAYEWALGARRGARVMFFIGPALLVIAALLFLIGLF
jgi:hypothetical protein